MYIYIESQVERIIHLYEFLILSGKLSFSNYC